MKLAYFDLIGGASGDMILGALIDAGLSLEELRADLSCLKLPGWSLETEKVTRGGIAATRARVQVQEQVTERTLPELVALLRRSTLPSQVLDTSEEILVRLGRVEAQIHQVDMEQVHLHELGGVDTIVDVVGAVAGVQRLGIERIGCSPFPLALGTIETRHGSWPLPAPAAVALLQEVNAPVRGIEGTGETVTPTGAAILTSLAVPSRAIPGMELLSVGYGAGARDEARPPNLLRVLLGQTENEAESELESLVELETNLDDLSPQFYDYVLSVLFAHGALDVTLSPLQMKKNRPGTELRVLCRPDSAARLREVIFTETTTLGVREQAVQRYALPRETIWVDTRFGRLRAKRARRPRNRITVSPEYDDCRRAAEQFQVPLSTVWEEVRLQATSQTAI